MALDRICEPIDTPLEFSLEQGLRTISPRFGIINRLDQVRGKADDPRFNWFWSDPADIGAATSYPSLNRGLGGAIDVKRAKMKAIGESIERYCASQYRSESLRYCTWRDLPTQPYSIEDFALFSPEQYATGDLRFVPLLDTTVCGWENAWSLTSNKAAFVPAEFVYVPYADPGTGKPMFYEPISTGLACHQHLATAVLKGLMEAIERDAFMLVWRNEIPCQKISADHVLERFLQTVAYPVQRNQISLELFDLTLDTGAHVVMSVIENASHQPHRIIGISAGSTLEKACIDATEEAFLTWLALKRLLGIPSVSNPVTLRDQAMLHATDRGLRGALDFLSLESRQYNNALGDYGRIVDTLHALAAFIRKAGMDVLVVDVTTEDIAACGFVVVRVLVPGLHPLDSNHQRQYHGGNRMQKIRAILGLQSRAALNLQPHPFP
jgi:ribosomal protein S12 methylthiotransferase accessory factor